MNTRFLGMIKRQNDNARKVNSALSKSPLEIRERL